MIQSLVNFMESVLFNKKVNMNLVRKIDEVYEKNGGLFDLVDIL